MGEKRVKLAGIRKIIGERMLESTISIPQATGSMKIDYTNLFEFMDLLERNNKKVSMTSIYCKAIGLAMLDVPELNSRLEGDEIVYYESVNPGIAIQTDNGLMVLVLRNVQKKSLFEIQEDFSNLIDKLRNNKLTMDDMAGGTITVSNLNKEKLEFFSSIITNHECLILGIGGISKQPVVLDDGSIAARDVGQFITNMNHIIVDGYEITQFTNRIHEIVHNPKQHLLTEQERQELK